uniref:Uncharacterized protein n=1 Tax=viral metagenome TaxID=1070528 RepID=A0A6C0BKE1_9ZZZZ
MDSFLKKAQTPVHFTYLGIGTNPHTTTVDALTDAWDQLMPVFVRDQLRRRQKVRVFHIDPQFKYNLEFLREYFATRFPRLTYDGEYNWTSSTLDVHVSDSSFYHNNKYDTNNDDPFLLELSEICLNTGSRLVVQEFTGHILIPTFKECFASTTRPSLFKKKILFDITYGNASCMTDLTKHSPLYDKNGDFINFALCTYDEIKGLIDLKRTDLNTLIIPYFKKAFIHSLEYHHVNYRRRVNGDICMNKSELYEETASSSLIMGTLQEELRMSFDVLRLLDLVDEEKNASFIRLMDSYPRVNMYDWNTEVKKLF